MPMLRGVLLVAAAGLALIGVAHAQTSPADSNPEAPPIVGVPPVKVIGTTPLPGVGIDRDKVPANVQSITSSDLTRDGGDLARQALDAFIEPAPVARQVLDEARDAWRHDVGGRGQDARQLGAQKA